MDDEKSFCWVCNEEIIAGFRFTMLNDYFSECWVCIMCLPYFSESVKSLLLANNNTKSNLVNGKILFKKIKNE